MTGLELFPPSSQGQAIYRPGKPGEIVKISFPNTKDFVPENPGLFSRKDPYAPDQNADYFFGEHRAKSEKDLYKYVALKILIDFYMFFH